MSPAKEGREATMLRTGWFAQSPNHTTPTLRAAPQRKLSRAGEMSTPNCSHQMTTL